VNAVSLLISDPQSVFRHITQFSVSFVGYFFVRHRVEFKLAVLVFKALHGLALQYLTDDCQLLTDANRR